ncbi:MAG TPA: hypothetical protein VFV08_16670, partial [Puia sp.]|nr:hypothetical protein [Puia sp.]
LDKSFNTVWKNKPVFVIGASTEDERNMQIWIDAENLYIVRILSFFGNNRLDQVLEGQVRLGGGWSETKTSIYLNDTLSTQATYQDFVADKPMDPAAFDPNQFLNFKLAP